MTRKAPLPGLYRRGVFLFQLRPDYTDDVMLAVLPAMKNGRGNEDGRARLVHHTGHYSCLCPVTNIRLQNSSIQGVGSNSIPVREEREDMIDHAQSGIPSSQRMHGLSCILQGPGE
jgi:hypothetical protein